jgi:hypothetical protein
MKDKPHPDTGQLKLIPEYFLFGDQLEGRGENG